MRRYDNKGYNKDRSYYGSTYQGSASYRKHNGLTNQGMTCYLNSVLQVLFMTKKFREATERYRCDSNALDFHLKDLFKELERDTASAHQLTKVLGIKDVYLQSDAAECFENILNKVTNLEASQLFQGILTTINKCSSCNKATSTEDPFWSLPLELEEESYDDYCVVDGINNFFKESNLMGENQLYCEHCSTKSNTKINVEINHHPEVLTLLLKRFKFNYHYEKYVKLTRRVKIPEILQIPPYGDMSPFYQLYAYVEHTGELRNGHYTVTIKDQDDDTWYNFNDDMVFSNYYQPFSSNESEIKNRSAYLLFYKKISATNDLNVDESGTSTSRCSKSDQAIRNDNGSKEGQKDEEGHSMSTSDKLEIDSRNTGNGNEQVFTDRGKSQDVDHLHSTERQDLDRIQDAGGKLSESHPAGLSGEDSVGSESDTRDHKQTDRQEQEKDNGAKGRVGKEVDRINNLENQKGNQQKVDQEKGVQDCRSEKPLTKYDLCKTDMNRTQGNRSNDQAQSNKKQGDVEHLTTRTDQHQNNLVSNSENPERCDQQKAKMSLVLRKPPQKRKIGIIEILGESYEICERIVDGRNQKYLLLKEICQASEADFNKGEPCCDPECNIKKLCYHIHTDSFEERCGNASECKRNAIKMQTEGASKGHNSGSEVGKETGPLIQPRQMAAVFPHALCQNETTSSFQSSTANVGMDKEAANKECNHPSVQPSSETTSSFSQACNGAGSHCSIKSLPSDMKSMNLNASPNQNSIQGCYTKCERLTGNQHFTESDGEKNSQVIVQDGRTDEGKQRNVCSALLSQFR